MTTITFVYLKKRYILGCYLHLTFTSYVKVSYKHVFNLGAILIHISLLSLGTVITRLLF